MGPMDWESDALTTRSLLHECLNTLLNVFGNESGELAVVWGHGGGQAKNHKINNPNFLNY